MFNIGDRVETIVKFNSKIPIGSKGTIVDKSVSGDESIGVRFDEDLDLHDCAGKCEDGHGWYLKEKWLEIIIDIDLKELMLD